MKKNTNISVIDYKKADAATLLQLLLELHTDFFIENSDARIYELREDKSAEASYKKYIQHIHKSKDEQYKVLLAKGPENTTVGFIIGSVATDKELVHSKFGTIEDWYVQPAYRGKGIGRELYKKLEKWMKEKGCKQVISDTWHGNKLSIEAHLKAGFFISGISFSKKLQ